MWTGALCPGPCIVLVLRITLSQDRHFQNCCHPHGYIDLSQLDCQRAANLSYWAIPANWDWSREAQ